MLPSSKKKRPFKKPYKQIIYNGRNSTLPHNRLVLASTKSNKSGKKSKKKKTANMQKSQTVTGNMVPATNTKSPNSTYAFSPTSKNLEIKPYYRDEKGEKESQPEKGTSVMKYQANSVTSMISQIPQITPAANDASNTGIAATALPDPIPADSVTTTQALQPVDAILTASAILPTSSADPDATNPTVASWIPNRSTSTLWFIVSGTTTTTATSLTGLDYASPQPKHLSVVIIVLIAIGATCLLAGTLIIWKCVLNKRKHRLHPTPSAPILQDTPLFGGKDRFSQRLWGGPSYNTISSSASNKAGLGIDSSKSGNWETFDNKNGTMMKDFTNEEKFIILPPSANITANYSPTSNYPATPATNIGMAIDYADEDYSDTAPLRGKVDAKYGSKPRRLSTTRSIYGGVAPKPQIADNYQSSRGPPAKPKSVLKGSSRSSGRERVQAPYMPRSASQTSLARKQGKVDSFMYAIPTVKDDERRNRDTKALASALGLETPPAPTVSVFSAASIYPDDSYSIAQGHRSEMASPSESHATLGNLMLQEYPAVPTSASKNYLKPGVYRTRSDDKPPRVPSPPPMPSLAQMALQNADPDYRSPTYSIYGLY